MTTFPSADWINEVEPARSLFLVVGIKTNYRTLLGQAIEEGAAHGFIIRILDLNALVPAWESFPNDWEALGIAESVDKIASLEELERYVKGCGSPAQSIVLFLYPPVGALRKAWRILKSRFSNVGMITLSLVPSADRLVTDSNQFNPVRKLAGLARKIKSLIKPVPSIWVVSGSEAVSVFKSYFRSYRHTRFIHAHSIEYEQYIYQDQKNDSPVWPTKNYLLVLDQGWFSKPKPDFLTDQQYPPASRDKFSDEIVRLLDNISLQTGLDILVSCHPKADLCDTKLLYAGYQVVNQPSSDLIRHCSAALSHTSTSIGYAVMASKPIILVTSDELCRSVLAPSEVAFSKELGIDYFNMSGDFDLDMTEALGPASKQHYHRYQERYIRQSSAEKRPLWPLVFSRLKELS